LPVLKGAKQSYVTDVSFDVDFMKSTKQMASPLPLEKRKTYEHHEDDQQRRAEEPNEASFVLDTCDYNWHIDFTRRWSVRCLQ
jgi:hypothetical protein